MNLVRIGDEYFDAETGEFAGPVDSTLPDGNIENEEQLLAYMRRLMRYEAEARATEMELKAIIANAEKMLKQRQRKVEWLKTRWATSAAVTAESLLPRKSDGTYRLKTWTCPFGEVKFTSRGASVEIADDDVAVRWAEANSPEAVKVTKKVLVSQLPSKDWLAEGRCPNGFALRDGSTSVTFKTIGDES